MKYIIEELQNRKYEKVVFVCHSVTTVFYACLIATLTKLKKTNYCIWITEDPEDEGRWEKITEKLSSEGIILQCFRKSITKRIMGISFIEASILKNKLLKKMEIKDNEYILVNFSWHQQYVFFPATVFFHNAKDIVFIDEAAAQFVMPLENGFKLLIRRLYGQDVNFTSNRALEKIYVRNPQKYRKELAPFLLSYDASNIQLDEQIIDKMLYYFSTRDTRDIFNKYVLGNVVLVLTQPFSEDGYMTENKKIDIYKRIASYYSRYGNVVIKVHPRDKTQYHNYYDYDIDYGGYPSELLELLGFKFEYAVGVCTSAIYSVSALNRRNLNENYLSDKNLDFLNLLLNEGYDEA